jgi:uncharacterized protein (TIGR03083 family)
VEVLLELGSRLDLEAAEPLVIDAFTTQRRRLLDAARALREDEWTSPTRCAEWNAHAVVVHVAGATDACRTTLTGERAVFGGSFDPNESPKAFVDLCAIQEPTETLEQLDGAISTAIETIEIHRTLTAAPRVTAVWGEEIDWRLFVTHFFWDSWIHERDLLVPLGREPEGTDAEARLATAYGLHTAAIVVGLFGIPLDVTVRLDGPGAGTYAVVADGTDVRISVGELDAADGPANGGAVAVTDSLAGRGDELAIVLDAPADVVEMLSAVGLYLRGETEAPPVRRR